MVKKYYFTILIFLFFINVDVFSANQLTDDKIAESYEKSYLLEDIQKYQDAIQVLLPILKEYPNGYTINLRLGWLAYLKGSYQDALNYYQKSLTIFPSSIEVMHKISLVHYARQNWNEMEEENSIIIRLDYLNSSANYWYAIALKNQKKYQTSENVCRRMLVYYPTSTSFLYELAENLYLKEEYDEALTHFNSVLILSPYNHEAKKYIELINSKKKK